VYGNLAPVAGNSILGQNTIDIGKLRYPTQKLTLGVKPVSDTTVAYVGFQVSEYEDPIINLETYGNSADTFNIKMFDKKGLYTLESSVDNIYLYNADGKNYKNSFFINGEEVKTRVFYHPEDKASTYYAYLSSETSSLYGYKLDQDILITMYDMNGNVIVGSEWVVYFDELSSDNPSKEITFTIYNPYPFTLNLTYKIDNADEEVNPDSKDKFTFEGFPDDVLDLLPGESKEFTVNFQDPDNSGDMYRWIA
jgi:hypothetical protein